MAKRIASWVAVGFLSLFLVLALVILPVSMELTNRQTIKGWLGNTELLEGAVEAMPAFLAQAQATEGEGENLEALLDQSGIDMSQLVDASETVFTPEYLRQKIYPVVDGTYDWLEGKTEKPEFNIVLSDRLTALADNLSKPLTGELEKLPACPTDTVYTTEFNPITAQCVLPGVNVSQLIDNYSEALTHFGDTPDISINSDDLELDDTVLTTGPRMYSIVNNLPLYLGGLILVFSVLVVLLGKSIKQGFRKLSWTLIVNGVFVGISYWLLGHTSLLIKTSEIDAPRIIIDNIITPITEVILSEISKTGVMLSLVSVSIGAVILLASLVHQKVVHSHQGYAKVHDSTPSEKSETRYINKISK